MKLSQEPETTPLALMQIARKTADRYRDVSESIRSKVLVWFGLRTVPPHFVQLVAEGGQLEESEQSLIFGESLPQGLRITVMRKPGWRSRDCRAVSCQWYLFGRRVPTDN